MSGTRTRGHHRTWSQVQNKPYFSMQEQNGDCSPKGVVDARRLSRFRGRQGRNMEKQFAVGFLNNNAGFGRAKTSWMLRRYLQKPCALSHTCLCVPVVVAACRFTGLRVGKMFSTCFSPVWMALCFRARTLRHGHTLHLGVLCVRQRLVRVPWDTFSVRNEPRKTLHCPQQARR